MGSDNISCNIPVGCAYVLDGGALIHRLPWSKTHMTYGTIIKMYTTYVINKYGTGATIAFDSYPDHPTTKDEAHRRRAGVSAKVSIQVEEAGTCSMSSYSSSTTPLAMQMTLYSCPTPALERRGEFGPSSRYDIFHNHSINNYLLIGD